MKKIIICLLGLCIVSLETSFADTIPIPSDTVEALSPDSVQNDTPCIKADSVQNGTPCIKTDSVQNGTPCLKEGGNAFAESEINEETEIKMSNSGIKETIRKIVLFIICAFILLLGLMVGGLYALYKRIKKVEEKYSATRKGLTSIEEQVKKIAKQTEKKKSEVANDVRQMVTPLEKKQEKMTKSMPMATSKQEKNDDTSRHPNEKEDLPPQTEHTHNNKENILYAKPRANGKELKVTGEQEAIYIIIVEKGKFRLYEKEEQKQTAIKNKEDMLTPFCNVTGSSIDAKDIKTISEGEVEDAGDDVWKVIKKTEIEFIK